MSKSGRLTEYKFIMTGAAGFLGRHLAKNLIVEGAAGVGIDICKCPEYLENSGMFRYIQGDFGNYEDEALEYLTSFKRGKIVFYHMAGLANAEKCNESPEIAFDLNVRLIFQALEFCRRNNIGKIIFPSTGLVYKMDDGKAVDEKVPAAARDMYTLTKLAAESLLQAYSNSYKLCGLTVRLSNVYGPGLSSDTVLGTVLRQVIGGGGVRVNDLAPVRDFIHIDDVTEGIIKLSYAIDGPGYTIVNLSTGTGSSIKDAVEIACRIASLPLEMIIPAKCSNPSKIVLNNELLRKITGWKPRYNLEEGLFQTIQFIMKEQIYT